MRLKGLKVWINLLLFAILNIVLSNCQSIRHNNTTGIGVPSHSPNKVSTNYFTTEELRKIDIALIKLSNYSILSQENIFLRKKITYQSNIIQMQEEYLGYKKEPWYERVWDKWKFVIGVILGVVLNK